LVLLRIDSYDCTRVTCAAEESSPTYDYSIVTCAARGVSTKTLQAGRSVLDWEPFLVKEETSIASYLVSGKI
jgi:hypothetical protein